MNFIHTIIMDKHEKNKLRYIRDTETNITQPPYVLDDSYNGDSQSLRQAQDDTAAYAQDDSFAHFPSYTQIHRCNLLIAK